MMLPTVLEFDLVSMVESSLFEVKSPLEVCDELCKGIGVILVKLSHVISSSFCSGVF